MAIKESGAAKPYFRTADVGADSDLVQRTSYRVYFELCLGTHSIKLSFKGLGSIPSNMAHKIFLASYLKISAPSC